MKEYLVINPFTSEGRNSVAAFNGFQEEWEQQCDEFNDSTPICDINFELTCMYAKHPTHRNVFLCLREGQHRLRGIIQAFTCHKLNSINGVLKRNSRLTNKTFIDNQFKPKDIAVDFQQRLQTILSSTKRPSFFVEHVAMRVMWIAITKTPVSAITAIQRILSEATSNNKRTSVRTVAPYALAPNNS